MSSSYPPTGERLVTLATELKGAFGSVVWDMNIKQKLSNIGLPRDINNSNNNNDNKRVASCPPISQRPLHHHCGGAPNPIASSSTRIRWSRDGWCREASLGPAASSTRIADQPRTLRIRCETEVCDE
jgi:hypothetical protein